MQKERKRNDESFLSGLFFSFPRNSQVTQKKLEGKSKKQSGENVRGIMDLSCVCGYLICDSTLGGFSCASDHDRRESQVHSSSLLTLVSLTILASRGSIATMAFFFAHGIIMKSSLPVTS